ncbi:MAG: TerC family protein [Vicinamibacteria bacterium]
MPGQPIDWIVFASLVAVMLALDLGVFHRQSHVVRLREAVVWSALWITLSLLFNLGIYFHLGPSPAIDFFTAYVVEKSLSIDNIFVFLLIFSYFSVPPLFQHRVLFWGILAALVMRAFFIATGLALIEKFEWILYVFGAFLVFTGIRMAVRVEGEIHPEKNPVLNLLRRFVRVSKEYHGAQFLVKTESGYMATPLLVALVVVETSDLIFAVDSIPAVLAISQDPFIVYTSNVFAILGLRALYFALAGIMELFHYLHYGLAAILIFVGAKMLLSSVYHVPTALALAFIAVTVTVSIVASVLSVRSTS